MYGQGKLNLFSLFILRTIALVRGFEVSSLNKKGLSSTCRVILAWKLALASRKSSSKYWRFVSEFIYISLYGSILSESHNEHNSQTSSTCNTNELLEPQRHQSYNTNSSWQWGQIDQTKCGVNLHCSAKNLKFIAKYLLARQFLMSRRQCSSNELLSLQKCLFFFSSFTVFFALPPFHFLRSS